MVLFVCSSVSGRVGNDRKRIESRERRNTSSAAQIDFVDDETEVWSFNHWIAEKLIFKGGGGGGGVAIHKESCRSFVKSDLLTIPLEL